MDQQQMRLLAKLKLKAKKELNINIDLQALARDAVYAEAALRAIEDRAGDEETLMDVLLLREVLVPQKAQPKPVIEEEKPKKPVRDYRFGARGG